MMQQRTPYGQQRPSIGSQLDRKDPQGYIRMAIVFAGAFIGAFVLWPMIRPAFIADNRPAYTGDARGYAPQASQSGYQGRRGYGR